MYRTFRKFLKIVGNFPAAISTVQLKTDHVVDIPEILQNASTEETNAELEGWFIIDNLYRYSCVSCLR